MSVAIPIIVGVLFVTWHVVKSLMLLDVQQDLHDRFPHCDDSMLEAREKVRSDRNRADRRRWYHAIGRIGRRLLAPRIRIFISYQCDDKDFATDLANSIESSWVPSFFHVDPSILGLSLPWTLYDIKCVLLDTDDLVPQTSDLLRRTRSLMRRCDLSVLVCGSRTATSSWVATETAFANTAQKPLLILRRDTTSQIPPNVSEGYPTIDVAEDGVPWIRRVYRVVEEILHYKSKRRFAFTSFFVIPNLLLMLIFYLGIKQNTIALQHAIILPFSIVFASVVWWLANQATYIHKWSHGWRFKRFRFARLTDVEDSQRNSQPEDEAGMLQYLRCMKWLVTLSALTMAAVFVTVFLEMPVLSSLLLVGYCASMLVLFVLMRHYAMRGTRKTNAK